VRIRNLNLEEARNGTRLTYKAGIIIEDKYIINQRFNVTVNEMSLEATCRYCADVTIRAGDFNNEESFNGYGDTKFLAVRDCIHRMVCKMEEIRAAIAEGYEPCVAEYNEYMAITRVIHRIESC
jgi:hypothetical protein